MDKRWWLLSGVVITTLGVIGLGKLVFDKLQGTNLGRKSSPIYSNRTVIDKQSRLINERQFSQQQYVLPAGDASSSIYSSKAQIRGKVSQVSGVKVTLLVSGERFEVALPPQPRLLCLPEFQEGKSGQLIPTKEVMLDFSHWENPGDIVTIGKLAQELLNNDALMIANVLEDDRMEAEAIVGFGCLTDRSLEPEDLEY